MEEMRLNKYLADMGYCSRREADRMIEAGRVEVDGRKAGMGQKIGPGMTVSVDGKTVGTAEDVNEVKRVLLAVYKPVGVVCTTTGNDRAENIVDMVRYPERIYPIGRLDKDSSGLILMTNRGELVNKIMKASSMHEKEYIVQVNKPMSREFLYAMRRGVTLKELGVTTRKCTVDMIDETHFSIILTQGYNRQIRRMCEALGYKVLELTRTRIMNITLGKMLPGTSRRIKGAELAALEKQLGL